MILPNIWENKQMFQTTNENMFPWMSCSYHIYHVWKHPFQFQSISNGGNPMKKSVKIRCHLWKIAIWPIQPYSTHRTLPCLTLKTRIWAGKMAQDEPTKIGTSPIRGNFPQYPPSGLALPSKLCNMRWCWCKNSWTCNNSGSEMKDQVDSRWSKWDASCCWNPKKKILIILKSCPAFALSCPPFIQLRHKFDLAKNAGLRNFE